LRSVLALDEALHHEPRPNSSGFYPNQRFHTACARSGSSSLGPGGRCDGALSCSYPIPRHVCAALEFDAALDFYGWRPLATVVRLWPLDYRIRGSNCMVVLGQLGQYRGPASDRLVVFWVRQIPVNRIHIVKMCN
jgi:hypothetical protein